MFLLSIQSTISEIIVKIGEALSTFISWVISLLPDDPYKLSEVLTVPQAVRDVLGFVNWLIPIGRCLELIVIWFLLVMAIYFIRVIFKVFQWV